MKLYPTQSPPLLCAVIAVLPVSVFPKTYFPVRHQSLCLYSSSNTAIMEKLLYLRQKDFGCSTESDIPMMLEMAPEIQNFNEAGHVQELQRNFSLLSTCSVGIVTGNTWAALGGTIAIAIYNGGPPGVIYEFMVVSIFYWLVAASLAELASSIPSSAGVYHWASITPGPRYGRICGFFAGWWNFFAWNFACGK